MADKTGASSIYTPKTLNELINVHGKNPEMVVFAGGTYIMSRPDYYPHTEPRDLICLNQIPELFRITHTERFLEVGAAITIDQLLSSGAYLLSKNTFNAIADTGPSVIRSKATVGGTLCTPDIRYPLSTILTVIDAQAEMRIIYKSRLFPKRFMSNQTWVPIRKLYSPTGRFLYKKTAIMTKVRLPAHDETVQIFKQTGSPVRDEDSSVFLGFEYIPSQNLMTQPNFSLCFSKNGFFSNHEFNSELSAVTLPCSPAAFAEISAILRDLIADKCPDVTEIQRIKAIKLFEQTIRDLNHQFISLV